MKKILILGILLFIGVLLFAQQNMTSIGKIETNDFIKISIKIGDINSAIITMDGTRWAFNAAARYNLKKMLSINLHMVDTVDKNNLKVIYGRRTDLFTISGGRTAYSFFTVNTEGESFITLRFTDQHGWTEGKMTFSPDEIKEFVELIDAATISFKDTSAAITLLNKELASVYRW